MAKKALWLLILLKVCKIIPVAATFVGPNDSDNLLTVMLITDTQGLAGVSLSGQT